MARRVYATAAEFAASPHNPTGANPTGLDSKLDRASGVVELATRCDVYEADDGGYPTDTDLREAMRQATCAQVTYWLDAGDEIGAADRWGSVGVGSVQLSRAKNPSGSTPPADRLAPDAEVELQRAGLGTRGASGG